jgi:hypothetical protein
LRNGQFSPLVAKGRRAYRAGARRLDQYSASMPLRIDGTLPKMTTALIDNAVPITNGTTQAV